MRRVVVITSFGQQSLFYIASCKAWKTTSSLKFPVLHNTELTVSVPVSLSFYGQIMWKTDWSLFKDSLTKKPCFSVLVVSSLYLAKDEQFGFYSKQRKTWRCNKTAVNIRVGMYLNKKETFSLGGLNICKVLSTEKL